MVVVIGFLLASGVGPRLTWLLLPVILVLLFAITAGIAMLLSALYVRYRDVAPIWGVISQALFYATPVFILLEQIQAKAPGIVRFYLFNPLATILVAARHWMIGTTPVLHATKPPYVVGLAPSSYMGGPQWLLVPAAILVAICVFGYREFSRRAPLIAEEL